MASKRIKTAHYDSVIPKKLSKDYYKHSKKNIEWEEGIRSKDVFKRLGKSISYCDSKVVDELIRMASEAARTF